MNQPQPKSRAWALARRIRAGWSLGNTLDASKRGALPGEIVPPEEAETAWHNPLTTRELIHGVRAAGFDAIRIPVTWRQHLTPEGDVDPAWMARVRQVADWALAEGLIALVNIHHDGGLHGWLQATAECFAREQARFSRLVRQLAECFRDCGETLVLESVNEMLDGEGHWTQPPTEEPYRWHNAWNQLFVDAVRAAGGGNADRVISLQTYSGGSVPRTLAGFEMPADSAEGCIMLQVHNYDPEGFCWLKAENRVMRDSWGTPEDLAELDALYERLEGFSRKHGAPVMIGEFGTEDKRNTAARVRHAAAFADHGAAHGIPCFWWDCGAFALLERPSGRVRHPEIVRALTGKEMEA